MARQLPSVCAQLRTPTGQHEHGARGQHLASSFRSPLKFKSFAVFAALVLYLGHCTGCITGMPYGRLMCHQLQRRCCTSSAQSSDAMPWQCCDAIQPTQRTRHTNREQYSILAAWPANTAPAKPSDGSLLPTLKPPTNASAYPTPCLRARCQSKPHQHVRQDIRLDVTLQEHP
jgi:hypothetical protein